MDTLSSICEYPNLGRIRPLTFAKPLRYRKRVFEGTLPWTDVEIGAKSCASRHSVGFARWWLSRTRTQRWLCWIHFLIGLISQWHANYFHHCLGALGLSAGPSVFCENPIQLFQNSIMQCIVALSKLFFFKALITTSTNLKLSSGSDCYLQHLLNLYCRFSLFEVIKHAVEGSAIPVARLKNS